MTRKIIFQPKVTRLVLAIVCSSFVVLLLSGTSFAQEDKLPGLDAPPAHDLDMSEMSGKRKRRRQEMRERLEKRRNQRGRGPGAKKFLNFVEGYVETVGKPHSAIGLAAFSLKERYMMEKNPKGAEKDLRRLLDSTKDQKIRNIFLFTLRQVHETTRNKKKFDAVNRQILEENIKAAEASN